MSLRPIAVFTLLAAAALHRPASACETASYGKGVPISEVTAVAAILDKPETFVGKEVRIAGKVKDVCEMAGCWMEIEAADAAAPVRTFRVKVDDGDIVFPVSARGKEAAVQGRVEKLEMSRARYLGHLAHVAEEQNQKFDESSVVGDGPFYVYQLAGTGAEICK